MPTIPRRPEDFTNDWLNEVLEPHRGNAVVTKCDAKKSDTPGQTAEVIMLSVSYDRPSDLPSRMVAKVTSEDPEIITHLIAHYDQYRRETSFYREFPDIGISAPRCLHQAHDPATQDFVLLMSDLAPAICPSWNITPNQIELALAALPTFHARWWNDDSLRQKDWMVQFDETPFFAAAFEAGRRGAGVAQKNYDDAETSLAALRYAEENRESLLKWVASRPFTFVHGDYHAKQMFFPTDAGGDFTVIDWQFPLVAPGAWDFARLQGMCMKTIDRRSLETKLMSSYVNGLKREGINDYNQSEFEDDYRFGLLMSQTVMCVAHADTDMNIFKKECGALGVDWQDAMLLRTQTAMEDWDVLDFLRQL